MRINSSAPTRIDLAGGTYDIWPLYLFHDGAQTINAALSIRARVELRPQSGQQVRLISDDTSEIIEAESPDALGVDRLPLVARLVRHFGASGVEVRTRSESPVGAGIAGSSAMNVALAGALSAWTARPLADADLLTLVMNIEAQVIAVPTGVQDYRPALYGGVSAVELDAAGIRRIGLGVDAAELGRRIVLAYTGASRPSGINNWDAMVRHINGDRAVRAAFDGIRDAATGVRAALEQRDWSAVAAHIAEEWTHRKRLAPGVATPEIDTMLASAADAGALAGKVCGAGGGGCLFCIVDPSSRREVASALTAAGAEVLPFEIDTTGLIVERS